MRGIVRRIAAIVIGVLFLIYGLVRLGVSSAMIAQVLGVIDLAPLHEPLGDVRAFLVEKSDLQIIPVTPAGYLYYMGLMGVTLTTGAIGSLLNKRFGLPLIGMFLVMWAALFVNFQTINPKIYHLAVALALYFALIMLKRERQ